MNIKDKMKVLGLEQEGDENKIVVSHVTIRQSISFLMFQLIVLELISGAIIIFFYSTLVPTGIIENIFSNSYGMINTLLFVVFVFGKILFMIFVVAVWLNEYYEITPREVIHKSGLFFRKEERLVLSHVDSVELHQSFLGRMFNFGNLVLFNWVLEKNTLLYLIHNPKKYLRILQDLLPQSDQKKQIIRERIIEKERV